MQAADASSRDFGVTFDPERLTHRGASRLRHASDPRSARTLGQRKGDPCEWRSIIRLSTCARARYRCSLNRHFGSERGRAPRADRQVDGARARRGAGHPFIAALERHKACRPAWSPPAVSWADSRRPRSDPKSPISRRRAPLQLLTGANPEGAAGRHERVTHRVGGSVEWTNKARTAQPTIEACPAHTSAIPDVSGRPVNGGSRWHRRAHQVTLLRRETEGGLDCVCNRDLARGDERGVGLHDAREHRVLVS